MLSLKEIKFAAAIIALVVTSAASTAVYAEEKSAPVKVCLSKDGKPTDRCMETRGLSLRITPAATRERRGPAHTELIFQVGSRDLNLVMSLTAEGNMGNEVEICIVNGANICPPEPFEIVWICITTSLLAGSECPHPPEASTGLIATVNLRSR